MSIVEFNYLESSLWFLLSVILCILAIRQGARSQYFFVSIFACLAFLAFGISDLIEAQTGAWWRPFWLFLFKAGCVCTLIGSYIWYKRIQSKTSLAKH